MEENHVGITVEVNGRAHRSTVEPRTLLVDYLRDDLGLTGTRIGCDTGQCGACTVIVDGQSVKSCMVLAVQADGAHVRTVEGLAQDGRYHAVQQGFWEKHGLQCGFCTPGFMMQTVQILEDNPDPSDEEIRDALEGNLCRCTGYQNIVEAVKAAGATIRSGAETMAVGTGVGA